MNKKIPANHVSSKKKNTYIAHFPMMTIPGVFELCKCTPIAVSYINGTKQETRTGWLPAQQFPNPYANEAVLNFANTKEQKGEKLASTIIEYLDKYTLEPVAYIFPDDVCICDGYKDESDNMYFLNRLNHATKRDFIRELEKRGLILAGLTTANQK